MNDCIEWPLYRHEDGYGQLRVGEKKWRVHRLAWTFMYGEIPEGMCVLHRCDNPPCFNPKHLFIGTKADNTKDMISKGRNFAPNKNKTHCKYGHPFEGDNLYVYPSGKRDCRACGRRRHKERYAQRRAELTKKHTL